MEHSNRTKRLLIPVSPEERELIDKKMEIAGFTNISAYARKMMIDGYTVNIDIPELRETLKLLHYAGNNLNQLVIWAHENDCVYETEIEEVRNQHKQMLSLMDSILMCLGKYQ